MSNLVHIFSISALAIIIGAESTSVIEEYQQEGQYLLKRMASGDQSFDGHDMARVYLQQGDEQRRYRRDLDENRSKSEHTKHLQLEMASGSTISLSLQPSSIVSRDTVVRTRHANGRVEKRLWGGRDCYSHGQVSDSSGGGWAAVSLCDGVFGFARSPEYDYFIQPAEHKRSKRDADTGKEFDVHVLWRGANNSDESRPQADEDPTDIIARISATDSDFFVPNVSKVVRRLQGKGEEIKSPTSIVIEMAMFSDQQYWQQLHRRYPGRESDFLLTRMAGTQALYSNHDKVGYDVQIKVKLIEHWKRNPEGYSFTQRLTNNLRNFCKYTKRRYFYDVHVLNTGVTESNKGQVGLAYVGGACTNKRCLVSKGLDMKTFVLHAHELGHTLGMTHHVNAKCPEEMKKEGGFMGGNARLNFSPCMKLQLNKYLQSKKSKCLFHETIDNEPPKEFQDLPNVFPGQFKTPKQLCHILAGPDYAYVNIPRSLGTPLCHWFVCLNENETSTEFRKTQRFSAPDGFPCNDESFCVKDKTCKSWHKTKLALKVETLQNLTLTPEWSQWSGRFSECSRSCGTGVKIRVRECQFPGLNMAPHCPGSPVHAKLCNTKPCPDGPKDKVALRQARADEICQRFHRNDVKVNLRKAKQYLPNAVSVNGRDIGKGAKMVENLACMVKCRRRPENRRGDMDALLPDGTPCRRKQRSGVDMTRFKIKLACLRGTCTEFSNCRKPDEVKDECGICGGNGSTCVVLSFNSAYNASEGRRSVLASIPTGSSNIDVRMEKRLNSGVILELWDEDDSSKPVIGRRGKYPKGTYLRTKAVMFAGTKWSYKKQVSFLQAPGPTKETVIIKAWRPHTPLRQVTVKYARGQT